MKWRPLLLSVILMALLAGVAIWIWLGPGRLGVPIPPEVDQFRLEVVETFLGSPDVPNILREYVQVSPDARHLAYVDFKQHELILDDKPLCKVGSLAPRLEFSPDGKHLAIVHRKDGLYYVVVDGRAGKGYKDVDCTIAPGRQHVTYFRFNPNGCEGEYIGIDGSRRVRVVVDLTTLEHIERSEGVMWALPSPDGRHVAEVMQRNGKWLVKIDALDGPLFDEVQCFNQMWSVAWSPDSRHIAYVARLDSTWYMVTDGQKGTPFLQIQDGPNFSPDGKRLHYQGLIRPGRHATVLTDVPGLGGTLLREQVLKWKWNISFSPDGRHVARTGAGNLVVDEITLQEGRKVYGSVVFNCDASRKAWWSYNKKGFCPIIDNQPGPASEFVTPLHFSPDGRRIMYVVGRGGKYRLVVDGLEGAEYDLIPYQSAPPVWSCDSKHFAYLARKRTDQGKTSSVLVVNGVESQPYDLGMWTYGATVVFDEPDRVRTVMFRQGQALRIDVTVRNAKQ